MINVNFLDGTPVVYRLYDGRGRLVYVGSSFRVPDRLREHRHTWWAQIITKAKFQVFPAIEAARTAESLAIQEEQPICNVLGSGRQAQDPARPLWTKEDWAMAAAYRQAAMDGSRRISRKRSAA